MYYFVVLREKGAAYYGASVPGVPGLTAYPRMRLLAVDAVHADKEVYAGVHQSVLGEIGFRADTRVYSTQVEMLSEFDKWYGSAHGADSLTGEGKLHLSNAEIGGNWTVYEGEFARTKRGLIATGATNVAMLKLNAPVGLVHVVIHTSDKAMGGMALIWRAKDEKNYWSFEVGSRQCKLSVNEDGSWHSFPAAKGHYLAPNAENVVQVADDGENIRLHLNGDLVYGTSLSDTRLGDGTGVGVRVAGSTDNATVHSFEAHPRDMPIPKAFDLGNAWFEQGNHVVVECAFEGPPGDLAGRTTKVGARIWKKDIGRGVIQSIGGRGAKVLATVEKPCPDRTAYTIEWHNPTFADVEVKITPPGMRKGMREKGRGGLIFWQDGLNYITLSLFLGDFPAMSIAAFFYRDGYEELYDAVWSNIGNRVHWGVPYDFRVVFDGKRFLAFINGEPVLYRALSDVYADWKELVISRVGIVANWEWGTDTGSVFHNFVVRDRA
ncbi:MAG: hypothetical protein AB1451_02405 [Nitrospirota bacterium]